MASRNIPDGGSSGGWRGWKAGEVDTNFHEKSPAQFPWPVFIGVHSCSSVVKLAKAL
jgi:hypothetical protein